MAEGPKRSEGVSQPEPRRSSGLALAPCARWYSGSRAGWQGLASALGTQVLQTQALSQRLEERAGAGSLKQPSLEVACDRSLIRLFALASPQIASRFCADFFFCECARVFSSFFSLWASGAKPALSSRSRLSLADAAPGGAWILSSSSRSTFIACVFLYLHLFLPACSLPFSDPGPTEVHCWACDLSRS